MIFKKINKISIKLLLIFVRFYQYLISPFLKNNCRYLPTCSEYTIQSLNEHGIFKGLYFSIKRILNCHPFGGEGFDPVPQKEKKKI